MPLTHRLQVLKALGLPSDTHLSIKELADKTHLPVAALQEVYNRGIGAWKSNPTSVRIKGTFEKNPDLKHYPRSARLGKEQWAMARLYSFINKGKTFWTADADIARDYKLG